VTKVTVVLLTAIAVISYVAPSRAAQRDAQLRLALVIPITSPPLFTETGEPARDATERVAAVTDELRALSGPDLDEVPFALSPSPLFCEELRLFGGGSARRATTALRALARRAPVLSSPYAEIRLTNLGTSRAVTKELSEGARELMRCTGVPGPVGLVATPDLRVNATVLEGAPGALLVSTDVVSRRPSITQDFRTLVPADRIPANYTPDAAFALFQGAETAAALLEPDRPDLVTFVRAVANDPRIELIDISDLTAAATTNIRVTLGAPTIPPVSYRRAVEAAVRSVARLRSYTLPNNRLVAVLRTSLARARSSADWNERWATGRARAHSIARALRRQERLISASSGSVTFTSQGGSVPVTVTNSAAYSIRVKVQLSSSKLRFPDGQVRTVEVDPPGDTIIFAALARSTGSFPVQVTVTSPDGGIRFHTGELTVRSTAANVPALVLTGGAALFLLAWYARHLARRRRERHGAG
jgi:hypothetical protein